MGKKYEEYLLFQRGIRNTGKKTTKNLVYYVQYRNYEGKQIGAVSTGETTKGAAHTWARLHKEQIIKKSYEKRGNPLRILLSSFYESNSQILLRRKSRGENISETHRRHCDSYCKNYFIPFFEESGISSVHDVKRPMLRELQDYIKDTEVKAKTVNSALSALRQIFSYLMEEEEIVYDPFFGLKPLVESGEKVERGTFPLEMVKMVLRESWEEKRYYLLSLLGATCGLRNSEVNALKRRNLVNRDGHSFLEVSNAFDSQTKTKTKAGKRQIPIHPYVAEQLLELIKVMSYGDEDYLFWEKGNLQPELKPLPYKVFGDSVIYTAEKMGLKEKYLNDNNITYYGWRHFYNSLLVMANVNLYKIKIVMGHSLNTNNDMTANYYKSIDNDYSDIINAVGVLFD
jgi:integrase